LYSAIEGNSVVYTIQLNSTALGPIGTVTEGKVLYWETDGTTTAADFTDNTTSGTALLQYLPDPTRGDNGRVPLVVITRPIKLDGVTDLNETMRLRVWDTGSTSWTPSPGNIASVKSGPPVVTSEYLRVTESSPTPLYAITARTNQAKEGDEILFDVNTVNLANETPMYWKILPVSGDLNAQDFAAGILEGAIKVVWDRGIVGVRLSVGASVESTESFKVGLYTDSARTNLVAESETIEITGDASTEVYYRPWIDGGYTVKEIEGRYSLYNDTAYLKEGDSFTLYVATNATIGSTITWNIVSTSNNVLSSDFVGLSSLTGTVTVGANSTGYDYDRPRGTPIKFTVAADALLEGNKEFYITVSGATGFGFSSSPFKILDSSQPVFTSPAERDQYLSQLPKGVVLYVSNPYDLKTQQMDEFEAKTYYKQKLEAQGYDSITVNRMVVAKINEIRTYFNASTFPQQELRNPSRPPILALLPETYNLSAEQNNTTSSFAGYITSNASVFYKP